MSDPVTISRSARESLARGLAALQTDPNLPDAITNIAEPIAQAMGALHHIERSQGAELSPHAETALGHVRGALAQLQSQPATHPAVANALEAVAASLGLVHQLSKMVQGPAAAQPAPAVAGVAPAAGIPRPGTQPIAPAPGIPRPQAAQPAPQPMAQPAPAPQPIQPQPVIQVAPQPIQPQPVVQAAPAHVAPAPQPIPQAVAPVAQAHQAQVSALAATANMGNAATLVAPIVMPSAPTVTQPLQPAPAAPMQATMAMPPQQHPPTAPQAFQPPAQAYPTAPQAFQPPGMSPVPQGFQPAAQAPQGPPHGHAPQAQAFQPVAQAFAPQAAADPFAAPRAPQASADPFAAPKAAPQAPAGGGGGQVITADLGAHSPTNFYKGLSGNDIVDHGGLFVATYMIPKIGTPVRLRVSLPGGYEFEAGAIVRWARDQAGTSDGSQPGFGAQLTEITSEARQLIYRYVRNREPLFHDDL